MKMYLEVKFNGREPEYPMDIPEEFESVDEFIRTCIAENDEIVEWAPRYEAVSEKLLRGEFTLNREEDDYGEPVVRITVQVD